MHAAAFLDRDGTIVEDPGFINSAAQMAAVPLLPGAIEGMTFLNTLGYKLFIVTNQGGCGLGHFTEIELARMHLVLWDRLEKSGVVLTGIKSCRHKPDAGCACRKPLPGMLHSLARAHSIDLSKSLMIGDRQSDVDAGNAAGCRSYLLKHWHDLDLGSPTGAISRVPHPYDAQGPVT